MAKGAKPRVRVVISPEICADGHAQQTDRLSALPDELNIMIWQKLDRDADKTCLALTCKSNAQFYNSLGKPPGPAQRYSPEQKLNLLQRLRGFSTLRKYKLCFKCGIYKSPRGAWTGSRNYARLRTIGRTQRIMGPNCPGCFQSAREEVEKLRTQQRWAKEYIARRGGGS